MSYHGGLRIQKRHRYIHMYLCGQESESIMITFLDLIGSIKSLKYKIDKMEALFKMVESHLLSSQYSVPAFVDIKDSSCAIGFGMYEVLLDRYKTKPYWGLVISGEGATVHWSAANLMIKAMAIEYLPQLIESFVKRVDLVDTKFEVELEKSEKRCLSLLKTEDLKGAMLERVK